MIQLSLTDEQVAMVERALDAHEVALLREARSRSASGPVYAEYRAKRRAEAARVAGLAAQIGNAR